MKWLKKVAATPLDGIAKVIDSLETTTNNRTNAPSIHAVNEAFLSKWYPIGSIYMSVNAVDPSELFGGTWEQIKDKFLLACGDTYNNGTTGGTATNTLAVNQLPSHTHSYSRATSVGGHALTVNEIPSHSHDYVKQAAPHYIKASEGYTYGVFNGVLEENTGSTGGGAAHNHSLNTSPTNTGSAGSGAAVNNMPPYLAVNVWVRTA